MITTAPFHSLNINDDRSGGFVGEAKLMRDPQFKPYRSGNFEIVHEFQSPTAAVKAVAFHPLSSYSHLLLVSFSTGEIELWDLHAHCRIDIFIGHVDTARSLSFHPSRLIFASGGNDHHIRIWHYRLSSAPADISVVSGEKDKARDRDNHQALDFNLVGHTNVIRCVQFYPTETLPWLISASDDFSIRIWNFQSRMCISAIYGHLAAVTSVCFLPNHRGLELFASTSMDQHVRVWNMKELRRRAVGPMDINEGPPKYLHAPIVNEPNIHGCLNRCYSDNGVVIMYVLEGHTSVVNAVTVHPKHPHWVASCSNDHNIKIWMLANPNNNMTVRILTHSLSFSFFPSLSFSWHNFLYY
jgi:coatomer protein complex subunit alpha (xenin)